MFKAKTRYFISYTFNEKIKSWDSENQIRIMFRRAFGSSVIDLKEPATLDQVQSQMREQLDQEDVVILYFNEVGTTDEEATTESERPETSGVQSEGDSGQ